MVYFECTGILYYFFCFKPFKTFRFKPNYIIAVLNEDNNSQTMHLHLKRKM